MLVGRSGALPPLLNAALLRYGAGAERVKTSNERSGAVTGVQKIKWIVSETGAGVGFIISFKSYRETGSVNSLLLCLLCRK